MFKPTTDSKRVINVNNSDREFQRNRTTVESISDPSTVIFTAETHAQKSKFKSNSKELKNNGYDLKHNVNNDNTVEQSDAQYHRPTSESIYAPRKATSSSFDIHPISFMSKQSEPNGFETKQSPGSKIVVSSELQHIENTAASISNPVTVRSISPNASRLSSLAEKMRTQINSDSKHCTNGHTVGEPEIDEGDEQVQRTRSNSVPPKRSKETDLDKNGATSSAIDRYPSQDKLSQSYSSGSRISSGASPESRVGDRILIMFDGIGPRDQETGMPMAPRQVATCTEAYTFLLFDQSN